MKNKLAPVLLAVSIILCLSLPGTPAFAANVTSTSFTVSGVLEARTCAFDRDSQSITLPDIDTTSLASKTVQGLTTLKVGVTCDKGVSSVHMTPSGLAVEEGDITLFRNTGTAQNVGLRLYDEGNNVLPPDGQSSVPYDVTSDGYVFSAGYAGTGAGRPGGGTFIAMVTFYLSYS